MPYAQRLRAIFFASAALLGGVAFSIGTPSTLPTGSADVPAAGVRAAAWMHRKVTINYFGITTLFTCDGLEQHVRQILLYLGARRDLNVSARGCPGAFDTPSHSAWVDADFYSLAPSAAPPAPDTVPALWTALQIRSQHPSFMGEGDCELVQEMEELIIKNFTLREVAYRTNCVPHEVTPGGFSIKAEVLKPAPAAPNSPNS